jgi:lipopolysaccharide export system protein LptA
MPFYIKSSLIFLFLLIFSSINAQKQKEELIHIIYADYATTNQKYPGKQLLSGHVQIEHNNALLFCDKAIVDKKENKAIAMGNVRLTQGDSIEMRANYISYDGKKSFAKAIENVFLRDPQMTLTTDTLMFDRKKQEAYYTTGGIIQDSVNKLSSKIGQYFLEEKKFRFINNVHIDNPEYQLDSYQLDYYTDSGVSNFYGPTKIYNPQSYIYAEKGHYDSKNKISWFVKNAFIKDRHTTIKGDSLYYDQKKSYANATGNMILHDSINKTWIYSNYGEYWGKKDSISVTRKPLLISITDKDTIYSRAKNFIMSGKKKQRKIWAYNHLRFYSKEFSGKSDSLYRDDSLRIMKLLIKPVIWSKNNQISGEKIMIKNDSLNKIDSLIIPANVFIIQKDSTGFNQIKGKELKGKFIDKKLHHINISGNTEVLFYLREDNGKLTGIEKNKSSKIYILFEDGKIQKTRFYEKVDGTIYPPSMLPENKLKGFEWRGKEQIKTKEDVLEGLVPIFKAEVIQKETQNKEERIIPFNKK